MKDSQTDKLFELLSNKLDCLKQIRDLGRKQFELIDQNDLDLLLKVQSVKQLLLKRLQTNEQQLNPFCRQDPNQRSRKNDSQRLRCAETARDCECLLTEIIQQELQSEKLLVLRRDEAATRLQGVHSSWQARGAYLAQTAPSTSKLDFSSEG